MSASVPCNGSCDIELARRQVGPDGVVPSNARECAELWEREAARLTSKLAFLERECANEREARQAIERMLADKQAKLCKARDQRDVARAESEKLREALEAVAEWGFRQMYGERPTHEGVHGLSIADWDFGLRMWKKQARALGGTP